MSFMSSPTFNRALLFSLISLMLLSACQKAAPIVVTMNLDTPSARTGEQVRVQADAGEIDVFKITFFVNGKRIGADARAPFEIPWAATAGNHTLSAEVETETGEMGFGSMSVSVGQGDAQTPFAAIDTDFVTGPAPLEVTFDATGSSDPNGDELSYSWNFGDGQSSDEPLVKHSYTSPGSYEVELWVRDSDGNRDNARSTITVVPSVTPMMLPLEVMGERGYSERVEFKLEDVSVDTLYLKTHRLAYRDASKNSSRGAKGSVRLNGGAWLDLSNETTGLKCYAHEAEYGCLNGAYHTVRFTVPLKGAKKGKNTLEFRFNGTDGFSNGYRVLELNLRQGASGKDTLSSVYFEADDPATWRAPLSSADDIAKGKTLWNSKTLNESPISSNKLRATCADCHAADGRDLKYFNYSNWSITERSKFHGLSELEGKQIASYIRSLDVPAPLQARPWNPPYQPGPDLDSKPAVEWAAGAGLEWVLETDADMQDYLFPAGTSEAGIRQIINKDATLNLREMPIAMQFPDWSDWLPEVHPLDAWGDGFKTRNIFYNESMFDTYERVRRSLEAKDGASRARDGSLKRLLNELATQTTDFSDLRSRALGKGGRKGDLANHATSHWGAVKTWEIMQEFELEGLAPHVFAKGEARSWMSTRRNVFEMAPHRAAKGANNFAHTDILVGKYQSTAWYQLQLVLNAGNGDGTTLWPVDWNYQPNHIKGLWDKKGPAHPLRYLASHTKMYQQFADEKSLGGTALGMRQIHIHRFVPSQSHGRLLETLPTWRKHVYEAMLNTTVDILESYAPATWHKRSGHGEVRLEPASYAITTPTIARNRLHEKCFVNNYANCWYASIPYFREAGVNDATLNRLINWGESIWAENNWDALR